MPIDLGELLDQLEAWVGSQVPSNLSLSELPHKMMETAERLSNDLVDSLTQYGPPSISLPFPPFFESRSSPPPPPPPPPASITSTAVTRVSDFARRHPYAVAAGTAFAVAGTVGAVGMITGVGVFGRYGQDWRLRRKFGTRGVVENGMLKDAIVILAPSPTPPLLVPLTATLLKAGYVVIVAVPHVKEAESLERRLSGLGEKAALRVLIYDSDDATTFPAFHRSLLATLTLRFPAPNASYTLSDNHASNTPNVYAYVSLYPMNPNPPSQPGQLPALPTLIQAGNPPALITLYPSSAATCSPDTFATQVLATNHSLLAANLSAASGARVVSVHVGDVTLPSVPAILSADRLSRRELARQRLQALATTSPSAAVSVLRDLFCGLWSSLAAKVGYVLGLAPARDYSAFETHFLHILKGRRRTYYLGQGSCGKRITGKHSTGREEREEKKKAPVTSSYSSDADAEDLASSVHTAATQSSSDTGLDGSWVVDA